MKIGKYDVHLLTLGHFRMDGGALFGIVPKKLWQRVYPHVDEENRVLMAAKCLLITGEGAVVVADAGVGEKLEPKARAIFCVEQPLNALETALHAHGVDPADVTHFIYTHLHFDHAGGATKLDDTGNAVCVFPNATHFVQREQLAWARSPSDKDRASFDARNWECVAQKGLLQELDGAAEILPHISVNTVHGHTPAMQMVLVEDSTISLIYTIDLFPSAAHLPVHYIAAFDNKPLTVIDEKRECLESAAERNSIILFGHDPELSGVQVKRAPKGCEIVRRFSNGEL
ncbi:MAG: MBL fold metallo-hydrolase [Candidatus Sumerlaeaceae bacterium]